MKIRHVLESQQFKSWQALDGIFREASLMEEACRKGPCPRLLQGRIMATLFYEPSTRTRLSFESAMKRLGGSVIGTEDAFKFSSAVKGETLEDTVRVVGRYADVIVIRHPEEGSARLAARHSPVPVINAGDGPGQHPTQTLLDAYTIWKEKSSLDDLRVGLVGDLLYGRAARGLAYLLAQRKGIRLSCISPRELRFGPDIREYLRKKGVDFEETENLEKAAPGLDVLYMTRVQKERFPSEREYLSHKGCYQIGSRMLGLMKRDAIIMHPLPRVDEILPEIDSDPRAAYFRQAQNGLYVRMALLKMILGG
jgi:aspartate carbamoyltransferase catalytic subunit